MHRLQYLAIGHNIEVIDIFHNTEHRHLLQKLPRVGPATVNAISRQWEELRETRELTNFLVTNGGMTTEAGMQMAEKLRNDFSLLSDSMSAKTQLFTDPFSLVPMKLLDFRVAEQIASGVHRNDPEKLLQLRIAAAVLHALKVTESSGNSGIPSAKLIAGIAKKLQIAEESVDLSMIAATGTIKITEIDGETCVFERTLYE
eukprot:gene30718-30017_t